MAPARKPKTKEMMSALMRPPLTVTAGTNGMSSRMTTAWNSRVRMTSATTERLATSARITGRTSRLSSEMKITAMSAAAQLVDIQLRQQPGGDVERDDARDERHDAPA